MSRLWQFTKRVATGLILLWGAHLLLCAVALLMYTVVWPPITGVQLQRAIEARVSGNDEYTRRYKPVSAEAISAHLPRAVVAAEDGRFYEHWGIDWEALQEVRAEYEQEGRLRGASTITQQLVKNLFLTTHRSYVRKALELPLTYLAELILSKERIVHLYANIVEWGPGVYGAEAAARHHFGISAAQLTRHQAAGLAACLPDPRARSPHYMSRYTRIIERRMAQHGW